MQLYHCTVNLNSKAGHQVKKTVTLPEIIVLRAIHTSGFEPGGAAPVADIEIVPGLVKTGENGKPITDAGERARLEREYGRALRNIKQYRDGLVSIFGHATLPLPTEADGVPKVEKKHNWNKPRGGTAPELPADPLKEVA